MQTFRIYLITAFLLVSFSVLGVPTNPAGDPDDNPVPITGLEYLLGAGGIYGAYRAFRQKSTKK